MMWTYPPADAEIIAVVEAWVADLTREDYDSAFSRTDHDSYYGWSPALIRAVVEGYGLPEPHRLGQIFKVTDRKTAIGSPRNKVVERIEVPDGSLAEVWYDLPLNGEWSDLTATFRVVRRDRRWHLVLEEIHVF